MKKVIKNHGKTIHAYRLGEPSPAIDKMIAERKIIPLGNGKYEVMTREALSGKTGHGQIADSGDYIKNDSDGYPYPNSAGFFETNHIWKGGDSYEQRPVPLNAWTIDDPICPEIQFLLENRKLIFNPNDNARFFSAPLWGTIESAPSDAVIIIYDILYDTSGAVVDIDFNFIAREEFDKTYHYLTSEDG